MAKQRKRNPKRKAVFRQSQEKKRQHKPMIKAYHNTNAITAKEILNGGYIRSNVDLKSLGIHPLERRTGDPSVPQTDEQAIFFYPSFAQYSSQRVTYGVNLGEIKEEIITNLGVAYWESAKQQRFSAFVFDAEALILEYGGRLRVDFHENIVMDDVVYRAQEVTGKTAVESLQTLREIAKREPRNTVIPCFEILIAGPVSLDHCLEIIDDAVADYNEKCGR